MRSCTLCVTHRRLVKPGSESRRQVAVSLPTTHGAFLLVPLTDKQLLELGLKLEKCHIVALRSDEPAIDKALRRMPPGIRPKLRDDHRAEFAEDPSTAQATKSNTIQEMELLRPQALEIAQLHPRVLELILGNIEVSEPSQVTESARCGEGSSAQPPNPRPFDCACMNLG